MPRHLPGIRLSGPSTVLHTEMLLEFLSSFIYQFTAVGHESQHMSTGQYLSLLNTYVGYAEIAMLCHGSSY